MRKVYHHIDMITKICAILAETVVTQVVTQHWRKSSGCFRTRARTFAQLPGSFSVQQETSIFHKLLGPRYTARGVDNLILVYFKRYGVGPPRVGPRSFPGPFSSLRRYSCAGSGGDSVGASRLLSVSTDFESSILQAAAEAAMEIWPSPDCQVSSQCEHESIERYARSF